MGQEPVSRVGLQTATGNKTIVLIATSASFFLAGFMSSGLNVALPSISRDFNASAILLSWIPTVYFLPTAVLLLLFGKISDLVGMKKVFVAGLILFTIAGAAAACSNSMIMLIASRAMQGIAGAALWGNSQSMITATFTVNERGRALGINVATFFFAQSSGPFFGGILTEHLGWRSIFWFVIPIGLAIIILVVSSIKGDWVQPGKGKLDYSGAAIYGLSLIALIYGFSELPKTPGFLSVFLGIFGLTIFLWWERRIKNPLLEIKAFSKNRIFIFSNIAALLAFCATFSLFFLLSLYLQYIKGYSPFQTGLILMAQPVLQAIFSPIAGRLSDKIEPRIVVSMGLAMSCLGMISFVFLNPDSTLIQIIISLMIIGIGVALFQSPNINATMSSVTPQYYSVASAVTVTMRTVGQTLSMGITMTVMAIIIGGAVITTDNHPAFITTLSIIFGINAALCLAGAFISHIRGNLR